MLIWSGFQWSIFSFRQYFLGLDAIAAMLMLFLTPHPQLSHTGGPCGGQSKNNVWEQCRLFWENYSLFLGRSGRKGLLTFFPSSWDRKWPEYRMLGSVVALGKHVCTTSTSWTDVIWPFLVQTQTGLCEVTSRLVIDAFSNWGFYRLCLFSEVPFHLNTTTQFHSK